MEMSDLDLTGKIAVVTGGSRGLGAAVAQAFAGHGATVVVASRKEQPCRELAAQITADTGRPALGLTCHVGRWGDCDQLIDRVVGEFGRIDVLVNNAGMSPVYPSLGAVTEELFDKVIAVNLRGPFRLGVLAGEQMAAGQGGSIINISSIAAVEPRSGEVPYAAAKAGLNNLTVALARCFGPTVRANAIMAGPFMTDVAKAWDLEAFEETARTAIPLRRGGQPGEIVGAALYLASAASSFTTGAIIKVDGGTAYAPG
jgi:NAD(P)-dependent dehydrogenase (short-subunit alcohol dehydrogenase family)